MQRNMRKVSTPHNFEKFKEDVVQNTDELIKGVDLTVRSTQEL